MIFGSLFSGIGGLDLGLERAGMNCAWQVEIDDYATRVLTKHWPDVPKFRDVRSVGSHNLPYIDLICGGFPCQDISSAGKRAGITGERSGLWREYARIIRELRPRYVLVENVATLLHRGIDTVLGDLVALGYDSEWHCIPAAAIGAPHIRDRVYIVAYPQCDRRQQGAEILCAGESLAAPNGKDVPDSSIARVGQLATRQQGQQATALNLDWRGEDVPHSDRQRCDGRRSVFPATFPRRFADPKRDHAWRIEPAVGRVAHGVPARVDRLRGLGNAVVPQVAEYIGRLIMEHAHVNA